MSDNTSSFNSNTSSYTNSSLWKQNLIIKKDQFIYSRTVRKNTKNTLFITAFILLSFIIAISFASLFGGYDFSSLFKSMFSVGALYKEFFVSATVLGVAGLSFLFAYKSGLFNIGISGQMLGSGLALVGLSKALTSANSPILNSESAVILSVFVVMITGAFIALISGLLKTFFNINEVVSAIMLNWIIFYLAKFFIVGTSGVGAGSLAGVNGNSLMINHNLSLYSPVHDSGYIGSLVLFLLLVVSIWFVFKFTSFGKKIIAVGQSKTAGIYSGFQTKTLQLSSFVISGAIAGVLALIVYTGQTASTFIRSDVALGNMVPSEGFNGIAISLVAFNNPLLVVPISLLFSMVRACLDFPTGLGDLILALTMYSIAIFAVVYQIKPLHWIRRNMMKKEKYKNSYFVYQEEENTKEFINELRKKLAYRQIVLFLERKKLSDANLSFQERRRKYKESQIIINQKYLTEVYELKKNYTPWYKSFNKQVNIIKEEN